MDLNLTSLLSNGFIGILIAVISARVTLYYALKRFYSEKKWERKVDAYANLIEALHHMKNYSEFHMRFEARRSEPPEDQKSELSENFRRAHAEVLKRADIGNYAISDEAVSALHILEKELEASKNVQGWLAHVQLENDAVRKCLTTVREIAKRDTGFK